MRASIYFIYQALYLSLSLFFFFCFPSFRISGINSHTTTTTIMAVFNSKNERHILHLSRASISWRYYSFSASSLHQVNSLLSCCVVDARQPRIGRNKGHSSSRFCCHAFCPREREKARKIASSSSRTDCHTHNRQQ